LEYEKSALLLENYKSQLDKIIPLLTEKIVNSSDMYIQKLQEEIAKLESARDISIIVSRDATNKFEYEQQIENQNQTIDSLKSILTRRTKEYINHTLPNISFQSGENKLNQNLFS